MTDAYVPAGKNFGFIRFKTYEEAYDATRYAGIQIHGRTVEMELAEGQKRSQGEGPGDSMKGGYYGKAEPFSKGGYYGKGDPYGKGPYGYGKGDFYGYGKGDPYGDYYGFSKGDYYGYSKGAFFGKGDYYGKGKGDYYGKSAAPCKGGYGGHEAGGKGGGKEPSIKVGNLPDGTGSSELSSAFKEQGVDFMTDCYIPAGKKFGFVRFASESDLQEAMGRRYSLRGLELELEAATGSKRSPDAMMSVMAEPRMIRDRPPVSRSDDPNVPFNPNVSPDAPSVKITGLPPGTSSEELHQALLDAGCQGEIIDVYVPKGNRHFGFVRFPEPSMAEDATFLHVSVRGVAVEMELAANDRKMRGQFEDGGKGSRPGPYGK